VSGFLAAKCTTKGHAYRSMGRYGLSARWLSHVARPWDNCLPCPNRGSPVVKAPIAFGRVSVLTTAPDLTSFSGTTSE